MKKRFNRIAIVGILVGLLIIGSVGTIVLAAGNPYQDFENAALKTVLTKNMTADADFTVTEDGTNILSGTVSGQLDGENQRCLSNVTANGQTVNMEMSSVDGNTICRVGDIYTSMTKQNKDKGEKDKLDALTADSSQVKLATMALDALVGDVKTLFTESGDKISVNLEGAQIPDIVNVALAAITDKSLNNRIGANCSSDMAESMMSGMGSMKGMMTSMDSMKGIKDLGDVAQSVLNNLSDIQNIQVTKGSMDATLSADGYISSAIINVTVTGTDSAGTSHTIVFAVNVSLSNIGSTTVSAIDTTGKTVINMTNMMRGFLGDNDNADANESEND